METSEHRCRKGNVEPSTMICQVRTRNGERQHSGPRVPDGAQRHGGSPVPDGAHRHGGPHVPDGATQHGGPHVPDGAQQRGESQGSNGHERKEPTQLDLLSVIATQMRQLQDAQTKAFQKKTTADEPEPVKPGVSVLPTLKGPEPATTTWFPFLPSQIHQALAQGPSPA